MISPKRNTILVLKYFGRLITVRLYLINSRNKVVLVSKFVSSILYTNILHQRLKLVMGELINFCFNGVDKKIKWDRQI